MALILVLILASAAAVAPSNRYTSLHHAHKQTLHHLPEFRGAVYGIPTLLNNESAMELVPLELQRVLQHSLRASCSSSRGVQRCSSHAAGRATAAHSTLASCSSQSELRCV